MGFLFEFDEAGNPVGYSTTDGADYSELIFERIKHINEYGQEFWYARELQIALEYKQWLRFAEAIDRAKTACQNSGNEVTDHFADVGKMVEIGSGSQQEIEDIELSWYACYLIVQNGDPRKQVISLGQTYFAVKTRQQELIENYDDLSDEQKRFAIRQEMRKHNKSLADAAHDAGIETPQEYAIFQNKGYQGLYGGLSRSDIHRRKDLKKSQDILDHMGHDELAANLFRTTQTEAKLRREKVQGKDQANQTHYEVEKKVHQGYAGRRYIMPAYKDKKRATWYANFYYQDWAGERKHKCKREFKTQREARSLNGIFWTSKARLVVSSFPI